MPKENKNRRRFNIEGSGGLSKEKGKEFRGLYVRGEVPINDVVSLLGSYGIQNFGKQENGSGAASTSKQKGIGIGFGPATVMLERRSTESPYYDYQEKKMRDYTDISGKLEEVPIGRGFVSGEFSRGQNKEGKNETSMMARYRIPFSKGGKVIASNKVKKVKSLRGVGKALRGFGKALKNGK